MVGATMTEEWRGCANHHIPAAGRARSGLSGQQLQRALADPRYVGGTQVLITKLWLSPYRTQWRQRGRARPVPVGGGVVAVHRARHGKGARSGSAQPVRAAGEARVRAV